MSEYKGFHHIFYQASKKSKPWAIEISANVNLESGIIQDLEVCIYSEHLDGTVRFYSSDKNFNFLGACRFAWGRLIALANKTEKMTALASDYDIFSSDFSQEYDKIMLEGNRL